MERSADVFKTFASLLTSFKIQASILFFSVLFPQFIPMFPSAFSVFCDWAPVKCTGISSPSLPESHKPAGFPQRPGSISSGSICDPSQGCFSSCCSIDTHSTLDQNLAYLLSHSPETEHITYPYCLTSTSAIPLGPGVVQISHCIPSFASSTSHRGRSVRRAARLAPDAHVLLCLGMTLSMLNASVLLQCLQKSRFSESLGETNRATTNGRAQWQRLTSLLSEIVMYRNGEDIPHSSSENSWVISDGRTEFSSTLGMDANDLYEPNA
ncbi:hypothetical protein DFH11DRAFT_629792 [Phellopilus nigrolimitatus]|nr:hypothetical protein DFH11DRAFT_629792 [Phellopilus nigrolimitatus]